MQFILILLILHFVGTQDCSQYCYSIFCKTFTPESTCQQQNDCQSSSLQSALCNSCKDNFYLNPNTKQCGLLGCDDGKTKYDVASQSAYCETCKDKYYLNFTYCWESIYNCEQQVNFTCLQCKVGYNLRNFNETRTVCIENGKDIANCQKYNNTQSPECRQCFDNYISPITTLDDGKTHQTDLSICYKNILNCKSTLYDYQTSSPYCDVCNNDFTFTDNQQLCINQTQNCNLYNQDFTTCKRCEAQYSLVNSQCQSCPIAYCKSCQSSILGDICSTCFDCKNIIKIEYVKGTNALSCIGKCESSNTLLANCLLCTNGTCTQCKGGYFVNTQGRCTQCSQKFANCDECLINKCSTCTINYYYDNIKQYCYPCSQFNVGCQACLNLVSTGSSNNLMCQKCLDGYYLSYDFQCIVCTQSIAYCQTCSNKGNSIQCLTCQSGYLMQLDETTNAIYCLDCADKPINLNNCQNCTKGSIPKTYNCQICKDGYYLSNGDCVQCQSQCTTCDDTQQCTKCPQQYLLYNGTCTQDINTFQLTSTTTSDNALAYTNIIIKKQSLGQYSQMGTLNAKGYFCQSDKQCNMYGRCLLISCKCIQNIFGSRCQYTTTSDFTKLQQEILSYLNTQILYDSEYIDILQLLADTTYNINESNLKSIQTQLDKFINLQFDLKYFSIIGAITKNIFPKETISAQKLTNFDQLLLKAIIKQSQSMRISEIQNTTGPFHKQIIGKFDLNSDDSFAAFKSNFVQNYQQCDNEKKFLTPQIYFTADNLAEIKLLQTDAQTPIIFNQMHLYYQNHRSSGQNINSTISRIQIIKNGTIQSINSLNFFIVVPKNDQYYADLHENNICVQWNEDKQIWENSKATLLKCKFYTVCSVNTFGDFGTYIQIVKNTTVNQSSLSDILYINTDFEFRKAVQNSAFAISMTLFGLFFVLLALLCILFKMPKKIKKHKQQNTYDTAQSGYMLDQQQIDLQNKDNKNTKKIKVKNFWSIYPVNAIFTATTLEFSLQKLSLYILQLQMYVTFTSIYLSSLPFKFGMLTAYYLLVIIQTWVTNYLYGGLALAFRKKKKGKVLGFYWVLWFILFFGNMIIGIWQMYGQQFQFDMYLLVGVFIEYVLDSIFCDLFLTYIYQSLFIDQVFGVFKIIKFKGYYEQ